MNCYQLQTTHNTYNNKYHRFVLYKERNMLMTEQQLSRRKKVIFPQPERLHKVRKSMGAIKQVLGERKRDYKSQRVAQQLQTAFLDNDNDDTMSHDEENAPDTTTTTSTTEKQP
jgi:hypothetical protein